MTQLIVWRHPKPDGARGRCIGRTDLAVNPRRAKRLAHRIRACVRREGGPRIVHTSPLERCAAVGRWLRRFGFAHRIDADLAEMDFGVWDGQAWLNISAEQVRAWEHHFLHHAPGGGESLAQLFERVQRFTSSHPGVCLVVGHAGWINAWLWQQRQPDTSPSATTWPAPPRYGAAVFGSNAHCAATRHCQHSGLRATQT
jgi:alpha-ribazole phosphatase